VIRGLRRLLLGVAAGMLGGALVGLVEAMFILSTVAQATEYAALFYAAVLYAIAGAALGVVAGGALAVIGLVWRSISDPLVYTLSFLGVFCYAGYEVTTLVAERFFYEGQGVPAGVDWSVRGGFAVLGVLILWLGPIFLTRTPFKIVLKPRGTVALFGMITALAAVFSFAPARGSPFGTMHPDRASDAPDDAPNLLVIVVDSLRADAVGAYGAPPRSPHMDRLAGEGIVYERAYASASWTRPSFATLLTGVSPSAHGVTNEIAVLPDEVETLAEALAEAGYVTGGLPNRFDLSQAFNFQQGFDYYRLLEPEYALGAAGSASQLSVFTAARRRGIQLGGEQREVSRYYQPADVALGQAQEFIDARSDGRPWFLVVHLMDPHPPYFTHPYNGRALDPLAPTPHQEGALQAAYAQEIQWMDGELGTFLDWMRQEGHYDETAVMLTADHGVEFFDHGAWGHGTTLYDELLHVPLVLKLPGGERAGERSRAQVRLLDVAPTLAQLGGHPGETRWQGRSLLDVEDRRPRVLFAETRYMGNLLTAVRSEGWKFIVSNAGNPRGHAPEELYRVTRDPDERQDLAGRSPELQGRMDMMMLRELRATLRVSVADTVTELDEATAARLKTLGYME